MEILTDFLKNHNQKLLIPGVLDLTRLLLVLPATSATSERLFSAMMLIQHIPETQKLGIH